MRPANAALLTVWLVLLASLNAWSTERAYYSNGDSITVRRGRNRVIVAAQPSPHVVPTALVATVRGPIFNLLGSGPSAVVRMGLDGTAPAGYRAGVLVSAQLTGLLSLSGLETVTLRTYLGGARQETQVVQATLLGVGLLQSDGLPKQLEFSMPTTKSFNRIEIQFNPAGLLSINVLGNATTKILYAYGVTQGEPTKLTGYLSRFTSPTSSQYSTATGTSLPVALCLGNAVVNPELAVDDDLTNYAYFNGTLSVGCTSFLKVDLNGQAPAGYRAGFVIGTAGLVGAGVLTGIQLRTYLNGVPQEVSSTLSPVNVALLANGKTFIGFRTSKPFDAVSIERASTVAVLDDLRLYFGFGLPESLFTTGGGLPIITSLPITATNSPETFEIFLTAKVCLACDAYVITPTAPLQDAFILLHNGLGLDILNKVIFTELTGPGRAGYRAGVVLGETTVSDLNLLRGLTIATFDANNNVLETATSESLLVLNVLPNRRREISFRTTRDFARIGVLVSTVGALTSDVNLYSAFADEGGLLQVTPPPTPLPVVLTSFAVSRAPGTSAATVAWATASEHSSAYFVVERTTDPQAGFAAIGRVAAAGTSAASHQYSLPDATAPTRATSYYRLRQVDLDGTESLSPVVALAATADAATGGFALYPNPTQAGTVALSLGAPVAEGTTIAVYTATGQVLRQQAVSTGPAPTLATDGLPAGMYHVVLRDAGGQLLGTQRLVITN